MGCASFFPQVLANGDWRIPNVIHHICTGCCHSRQDTVTAMKRFLIPCLLSHIKVIAYGKWTGAQEVYSSMCLCQSVHGLLSDALLRVFKSKLHERTGANDDGDATWHQQTAEHAQVSQSWAESDFLGRCLGVASVRLSLRACVRVRLRFACACACLRACLCACVRARLLMRAWQVCLAELARLRTCVSVRLRALRAFGACVQCDSMRLRGCVRKMNLRVGAVVRACVCLWVCLALTRH